MLKSIIALQTVSVVIVAGINMAVYLLNSSHTSTQLLSYSTLLIGFVWTIVTLDLLAFSYYFAIHSKPLSQDQTKAQDDGSTGKTNKRKKPRSLAGQLMLMKWLVMIFGGVGFWFLTKGLTSSLPLICGVFLGFFVFIISIFLIEKGKKNV
ncbi:MAG: hypothetical protein OXC40_06640 [Proteobacteria bacterium]|nr:hypothetical protein [Pseudomonadota bacterium]